MQLEQGIIDMFHANSTMFADALFLYDRELNDLILSDVHSASIAELLEEHGGILKLIKENNNFTVQDISRASCWSLAENPNNGRLSVNVCLDMRRSFFVNFQVVVLPWDKQGEAVRYLLCSLHYSSRRESDAHFIDREGGKLWKYHTERKRFELLDIVPLTEQELDFIRLCRMDYKQQQIASLMHKSTETISYYKRRICEKMNLPSIDACIAFCEHYHII